MASGEMAPLPDPVSAGDFFYAVRFAKSNSTVFDDALEVAKFADKYYVSSGPGRAKYFAVFGESPKQVECAMRLTFLVRDWKGSAFFARGRMLNPVGGWLALEILTCISAAQRCADWRAHCLCTIDNIEQQDGSAQLKLSESVGQPSRRGRYQFPCAQLKMYFSYDRGGIATLADQVQARAVERNVDWCPFFSLDNLRPMPGEISV